MKDLLASWDIGDVVSNEPIDSYWGSATAVTVTSGDRYILKRRNIPGGIDKECRLGSGIANSDVSMYIGQHVT